MKLKQTLRQKKNYVMLVSMYFAVMLISLVIGIWYYMQMKDSIIDSTLKYSESMIELLKTDMDRELNAINFVDYYIEISDVIQGALKNPQVTERERYSLMTLLNRLKENMSLAEDICVYLEHEDMIVSSRSVMESSRYFESQCRMEGYTYEMWKERYLSQIKQREFYPAERIRISDAITQNIIVYKRTLFSEGNNKLHILVMLDADEMMESLDSIKAATQSTAFIVDSAGNKILGAAIDDFKYDVQKRNILFEKDKNYVDIYAKSDRSNLVYVSRIRKKLLLKEVHSFMVIGLIFIALYILLGVAFLWFSGYIIYSPVRSILKKMGWSDERNSSQPYSDMEIISAKIDDLLNNEMQHEHLIEALNDDKKKAQLQRLLIDSSLEGGSNLLLWEKDSFMVLLVRVLYEEAAGEENEKHGQLIRYGVFNILSEFLNNFIKGEIVELHNHVVIIFNFDRPELDKVLADVVDMSQVITEIFENEFSIITNLALSSIHQNENELNLCFHEALTALDFMSIRGESMALVRYDDVCSADGNSETYYYWPSRLDEFLLTCMNKGDYQSIETIIDEIVVANLKNITDSKLTSDYVWYNLLGSYLRIAPRLESSRHIENMRYRKDKSLKDNIDILKEQFREVCEDMRSRGPEDLRLLSRIEDYIDAHFCENSLNLMEIAEKMQISVQYLTLYFKKHKNTTLLKYITQKRMEKARQLLEDSTLTITDIALMVGYTDASGFTKVFKKHEKITPGQYRMCLQKNEQALDTQWKE